MSLQAARSHRERKKEYISGIEQELRQVRDKHVKQIAELENENQQLRSILAAHQIHVPPPMRSAPLVAEAAGNAQQSHVNHFRVSRSSGSVPQMGVSVTPTGQNRLMMTDDDQTPQNGGQQQTEAQELEEIQKAVNFVLA